MARTKKPTAKRPEAETPASGSKKPRKSASGGGRKSSPDVYTDPELRDRLKAEIQAGDKGGEPGQWSARKSQLLASEYKKAGGGYKKDRKKTEDQKDLDKWTEETWTTRDGEPAIRDGETARYLPEEAWESLTPAQQQATDAKKRAGSRKGSQHVSNTEAAHRAREKVTS